MTRRHEIRTPLFSVALDGVGWVRLFLSVCVSARLQVGTLACVVPTDGCLDLVVPRWWRSVSSWYETAG